MEKPKYHFIVCNSFRMNGEPKGKCNKKDAGQLMQCLEEEVLDRELDAVISACGCLKYCEEGPVMVVQPNNEWYGHVTEEKIEEILDALEAD